MIHLSQFSKISFICVPFISFLHFEGSFFQIGSTEWVEENLEDLQSKAVAYLNVDCAVQGIGLFAGSTPQLDNLLVDVTRQVEINVFPLHFSMSLGFHLETSVHSQLFIPNFRIVLK